MAIPALVPAMMRLARPVGQATSRLLFVQTSLNYKTQCCDKGEMQQTAWPTARQFLIIAREQARYRMRPLRWHSIRPKPNHTRMREGVSGAIMALYNPAYSGPGPAGAPDAEGILSLCLRRR